MAVVFIESSVFERRRPACISDDELVVLQQALLQNPRRGVVIPGSGGLRKLRWTGSGRGKRGGIRVIYYIACELEIWLLTIYGKNEAGQIPVRILRRLKNEMENG
jgi:mRNA-degrading endonuclease RelE of RelBE toxin-antitoxin system